MEAPEAVKRAFAQLKLEYPSYIVLARINGKFYVYKSRSTWDKATKRVRSRKEYLGRITNDGQFIKRMQQQQVTPYAPATYEFDAVDEKIMMHLSMNCRAPVSVIAKRVGLSVQATERRKENLEKRFGIRYLASIKCINLGYSAYLILIKFKDKKPTVEELEAVFEKEARIQLGMITQGAYDLVLYVLAENSEVLNDTIYGIRNNELIKNYESIWNVVVFYEAYGYIPLRDKFFDLVEKKVWHRSKTSPRPTSDSLTQREYFVLKELSADGSKAFADIERRYNLGHGAARYTFDKLKERGLILRETLTMKNYSVKYTALVFVNIINEEAFLNDREKFLRYIIKDYNAPSNRLALAGDMFSPYGELFVMPILKDGELESELEWLGKQVGGIKLDPLIVTKIFLGELCFRKLDNKHAHQTNTLVREYKAELPKDVVDYYAE